MYQQRKPDHNQKDVCAALKALGAQVVDLSAVGGGCPDLLVGYSGMSLLLEVKNPQGRNRVDPKQVEFHASWKGAPVYVVRSPQEAVDVCAREAAKAHGSSVIVSGYNMSEERIERMEPSNKVYYHEFVNSPAWDTKRRSCDCEGDCICGQGEK